MLPQSATTPGVRDYLLARAQGRDRIGVSLLQDMCVWPDILFNLWGRDMFSEASAPLAPTFEHKLPASKKDGLFFIGKTTCGLPRASPVKSGAGVADGSQAGRARRGVRKWKHSGCPPTAPGLLCQASPRGSREGQRVPWVLGAFPLRSSCPFKSKSRERGS